MQQWIWLLDFNFFIYFFNNKKWVEGGQPKLASSTWTLMDFNNKNKWMLEYETSVKFKIKI